MDELQMDRPTAAELLEIVAETLSDTVVPATAPHAQHQARVAANLCRIIAREVSQSTSPSVALPDSLLEVDDEAAADAYDKVVALVRSKLAVVKPGYDDHGAAQERSIVS